MRLAFFLETSNTNLHIAIHDAANVSGEAKPQAIAIMNYTKAKSGSWLLLGTSFPFILTSVEKNVMSKLARATADASKEGGVSPLTILRALLARRSVQLAHDGRRYRCVSTMKEGCNLYEACGTSITFEASDDESAIKIAKREVANEMAENPESAAKLVAFFSNGCKVKQIASGALPDYVKVESLAVGAAEEKLAKLPVKLSQKDEDE